jgi:hypothetical protein
MKKPSGLKGQSGQVIVEYILTLVVVLSISFMLQKWLKDKNFVQNFAFHPWEKLNGMIQCGTWTKCGVETPTPGMHANSKERVLSLDTKNL